MSEGFADRLVTVGDEASRELADVLRHNVGVIAEADPDEVSLDHLFGLPDRRLAEVVRTWDEATNGAIPEVRDALIRMAEAEPGHEAWAGLALLTAQHNVQATQEAAIQRIMATAMFECAFQLSGEESKRAFSERHGKSLAMIASAVGEMVADGEADDADDEMAERLIDRIKQATGGSDDGDSA